MIWEPNLRRIVNRLLLLWYYLAFRVVILHDRHLPSIAAHNNSHRGCRPRHPRETQHCTLCTEFAFRFEQIMNHFTDPGHNPWLQLAFPLKFLWFIVVCQRHDNKSSDTVVVFVFWRNPITQIAFQRIICNHSFVVTCIDLIQSQNLTTMTKERKVLVIRLRATQMCDVCRTFFFKKNSRLGSLLPTVTDKEQTSLQKNASLCAVNFVSN